MHLTLKDTWALTNELKINKYFIFIECFWTLNLLNNDVYELGFRKRLIQFKSFANVEITFFS